MYRTTLTICLLMLIAATGCRQPANGTGQAMFDLTQPRSWFARNQTNAAFDENSAMGDSGVGFNNSAGWSLANNPQQTQWFNGLAEQVKNLNQRIGQFDNDNQQLVTEVAGLKQKLQAANEYNYQLKQQLTDSVSQLQMVQNDKQTLEQQMASLTSKGPAAWGSNPAAMVSTGSNGVPAQLPSGVALKANNSLLQKVQSVQIPGVTTRMDGDVIRIEFPSDGLFTPGSFQIGQNFDASLRQLASVINRDFPRQLIGIEGHWDNSPVQPGTPTHQQLTASQSLAVLEYLVRLGLPEKQLFTMAMGSNRPRYPTANTPTANSNRRIEVVIYPETMD